MQVNKAMVGHLQAVTRARMAKEKGRDFADWTYFWQPAADTEEGEGREEGQGQ